MTRSLQEEAATIHQKKCRDYIHQNRSLPLQHGHNRDNKVDDASTIHHKTIVVMTHGSISHFFWGLMNKIGSQIAGTFLVLLAGSSEGVHRPFVFVD